MADEGSRLLNVRETAKRLGVHENTVRAWARQGLIPDARVPGSRFHKFREEDVERLRAQRGQAAVTLQTERRTANSELAGASELNQWPWTRGRDAQETFPELIRRLVSESPGASIVTLRAGDGVAIAGVDGVVESDGQSPFLPAGRLVFELGVDADPKRKATSDFKKRAGGSDADCVFIFATPRRWPGAERWADEHRATGMFRDVRVIDADVLEGWLQQSPSAHHWISEHLGLRPRHAISLDTWWYRFSSSTDPFLPLELFTAGRREQLEALRRALLSEPGVTAVESEWVNDGLAFVQAAVTLGESRPALPSPLVIDDAEAWDRTVERAGNAILIPRFDNADVDAAVNAGHHVVVALDPSCMRTRATGSAIQLPRLRRSEAVEAFEKAGVAEWPEADRLAALARRSLPALVRQRSRNPKVQRPRWAQPPQSALLAPLILAGSWQSRPADEEALTELAGTSWSELERALQMAAQVPDPLFRTHGDHWTLSSPEEAFLVLRDSITPSAVERWKSTILNVLLEPDPFDGMQTTERLAAQMKGVEPRISNALRQGLAQGLAMTGAIEETAGAKAALRPASAEALVRQLMLRAMSDKSGQLLRGLSNELPLLAEAAPDAFLTALEDDLAEAEPTVAQLFTAVDDPLTLGPSSHHPSLLWAIETLCWSSDYLVRSAQVLVRLSCFPIAKNHGNRPSHSLSSVLCGWVRHTNADLTVRLEALDAVHSLSLEGGRKLLLDLWPARHNTSWPPSRPRFRMWLPTSQSVPMAEWVEFVRSLVSRAIEWSRADPELLIALVDGLNTVGPDERNRLIEHLETQAVALQEEDRLALFEKLQLLVLEHERFADSDWALPADVRQRLHDLEVRLEPTDDIRRFAYLFDWRPDVPGVKHDDFYAYRTALDEHRRQALDEVLKMPDPVEHLAELARRAKAPSQLGWHLGERGVNLTEAIRWLESGDEALREVASHWLSRAFGGDDDGEALRGVLAQAMSEEARELALRAVPANRRAWTVLSERPSDERTYWSTASLEVTEPEDAVEAVSKLLEFGRAWEAIAVAAYGVHERDDDRRPAPGLTPELVIEILETAMRTDPSPDGIGQMTAHYIGDLLDYLVREGVPDAVVARFEFGYFRILDDQRPATALTYVLADDPHVFVDLVRRAFRAKNAKPSHSSDDDGMATQAWWVLKHWRGFPGKRGDTIDTQAMFDWVRQARLELSDLDREDIGDELIGQAFAHCPPGDDGIWPPIAVRELVESIGSRNLENGLIIGRLNRRGVTSRGIYQGGDQERALADELRQDSRATQSKWPRTARMLRSIAESYEKDALHHDQRAEVDQDRD